jgi:hypothetical protein
MQFTYTHLRRYPTVFKQLTGITVAEFDVLYDRIVDIHKEHRYQRLERDNRLRDFGGGDKPELDVRHQLLVTVIWLYRYWTHSLLGFFFDVSQPTISRYVSYMLPVLEKHGLDTMRTPIVPRKKRLSNLQQTLDIVPDLQVVIDSFEQKVQRPKEKEERDEWYSGKKKSHTAKSQVAVDTDIGQIIDVSDSTTGKTADIKLLEQSGLLENIPPERCVGGDLGYKGIEKLHPNAHVPRKKPRNQERSQEDIAYNRCFSQKRVVVENSINRLRHYQSLKQTDRNHRQAHTKRVRAVAGLVNLQLQMRFGA